MGIRKGMWCVDQDGAIGIAHEDLTFGPDGKKRIGPDGEPVMSPTFHHVDARGDTVRVEYRAWAGLRQARRDEIPEPRRPDGNTAVRLGYA